jgi:hypothetical protein
VQHLPAVRLEALRAIVREGEIRRAVDCNAVVVVEPDQLPELEVAGEARGFMRDAFHQVAIATYEVGVVVDDVLPRLVERRGQVRLRDRHPHRVPDPLSERAGGGLDARRVTQLGVSWSLRLPLPKLFQVVEREVVSAQVQAAVEQHRRVAAGQHEPVAIGPVWIGGVVPHRPREEHIGEGRQRHRRSGVTGLGLLHGVHRQRADCVDREKIQVGRRLGRRH